MELCPAGIGITCDDELQVIVDILTEIGFDVLLTKFLVGLTSDKPIGKVLGNGHAIRESESLYCVSFICGI